jgi:biotin carboxyl carrier protein
MKLNLTINGRDERIELAPGKFRLGDAPEREVREVSVETPQPGVYSVLLDGRSYDARVEDGAVIVCGHRFEIEVRDPRRYSRQAAAGAHGGAQRVASPMPGKVVRVLVSVGDVVEAGQGIVVVEAMKMQNEMKAARAGKIASISVQPGATVTAGEVLASIE